MKIALIDVGHPTESLAWQAWACANGRFGAPAVGLVSLASLVRPDDEVAIFDEKVDGPVTAESVDADLVGLSFKTMYAERAYALADDFRKKGAVVAVGGLHASLCPDEAGAHADIVVTGEGEAVWPTVLDDVERGRFAPRYAAPTPPAPIAQLPRQRVELLTHSGYALHGVQSARGCSLDCEFCPTRAMFGHGFRLRDPAAVLAEVRNLLEIENKPILFTDDVFGAGDPGFIAALTDGLAPLRARYVAICDMNMLTPGLTERLARSGCRVLCVNMPGTCDADEAAAIKEIRANGVAVWGYFMFGFEFHGPDVFDRVTAFVEETGIEHLSLTVLAPYPGTPMGRRLEQEGRLLSRDLALYDQCHVVFRPANMTPEQLEAGFARVVKRIGHLCPLARVAETMRTNGKETES